MINIITAILSVSLLQNSSTAGSSQLESNDHLTSIVIENDLFANTDRNYTSGLRVEHVRNEAELNPWLERAANFLRISNMENGTLRDGFALSHTLYTPDDITLPNPPLNTQPYAAHLSAQFFASLVQLDLGGDMHAENTVMIDLGFIGPSAGGKFIQSEWHQIIDGKEPRGWDNQLHDELVFAISGNRVRRLGQFNLGPLEADMIGHFGLSVGTLRSDMSTSLTVRVGRDLGTDLSPPRLRPSMSPASLYRPNQTIGGYIFAGLGGYGVAQNVFLDGNTYRSSRSVDKNHWVGDLQAGLALMLYENRLAFTYVVRSEEFQGQQGPQRFGAISFSRVF